MSRGRRTLQPEARTPNIPPAWRIARTFSIHPHSTFDTGASVRPLLPRAAALRSENRGALLVRFLAPVTPPRLPPLADNALPPPAPSRRSAPLFPAWFCFRIPSAFSSRSTFGRERHAVLSRRTCVCHDRFRLPKIGVSHIGFHIELL